MTPAALSLQLLSLIGIRSLSLADAAVASLSNQPALNQSDLDFCGICLTGAAQEIFALGPPSLSQQEYSEVLRAPVPVTFTATKYSRTISAFASWQSWMTGCTIQGTDGEDNELLSATELVRPFMGTTGSASGTVYNDALLLPSWMKNVIGPVDTPTVPNLQQETREGFERGPAHRPVSGRHPMGGWWILGGRIKSASYPSAYMVEPRYDPTTGALPLIMRFNPMPSQDIPVTFMAARKPPVVTSADIVPETVVVSGTLTPDITGVKPLVGVGLGNAYAGGTPPTFLYYQGGWQLFCVDSDGSHGWYKSGVSTDPSGDYDPADGAIGVATVTVSGGGGSVVSIPTDWHESILLPFAKKRFIAHQSFNNPSVAQAILRDYADAKDILDTFRPQVGRMLGDYR